MATTFQATFLLFLFAYLSLSLIPSSEGFCPQGRDVAIHRDYKSGEQLCCQIKRCERGYEAVACKPDDPHSTSCRPCPVNTFQPEFTSSVDMMPCSMKQTCREGMKVEYDLSPVKDRKCVCDVEQGLCNSSRSRSQFCQPRNCSAGLQLNPDCSCSECESGSYKETNGTSRCRRWRNCEEEGRETLSEGSSVTDRVCGKQIDGMPENPLPSPSPSKSVSTNNTSSPDMHETTETPGRNESNVGSDGDNKTWTTVTIACAVIIVVVLIIALGLVAKHKRWFAFKTQSEFDTEAGANRRREENQTLMINLATEPQQNQNAEANPLIRAIDNQGNAEDTTVDQPQTLPNRNNEEQTDTPIKEIAGSLSGKSHKVPDWREKLNSCRATLVKSICYSSSFIAYLMINNTITGDMKEIIEAEKTRMKRLDKLMDILPKRPSYAFPTLILALVLTDQFHLAKKIDADLAAKFEDDREHLEDNHVEILESFRTSNS